MEHILQDLQGRLLTQQQMQERFGQEVLENIQKEICVMEGLIRELDGTPVCQRCHNHSIDNFATMPSLDTGKEIYYCLQCLQMGRILEGDKLYHIPSCKHDIQERSNYLLTWKGKLSPQQEVASQELIASLTDYRRPHLVYAVTGAGKTEMIFPVINEVLMKGGRVALASPRVDVCLELFPRIQAAFENTECLLMYGGTDQTYHYTPIVVLTTHQLLKFREAFDLVVVDEVDAFPYVNSNMLHEAVNQSVKKPMGKRVYLTATPDAHLFQAMDNRKISVTRLPARFHGFPLVVPEFVWVGNWQDFFMQGKKNRKLKKLIKEFLLSDGARVLFSPSIEMAEQIYRWMLENFPDIPSHVVHSKDSSRKEKVQKLRDGTISLLISTTILERGVTFNNCQVLIIGAESSMYSSSALVQMSGRVGRKADFPTGRLIFAHFGISKAMKEAKRQIQAMNALALERGLLRRE